MNHKQMIWATLHDWFLYAFQANDQSWLVIVGSLNDKRAFADIQELKLWAGY